MDKYYEELPENCPPTDAVAPVGDYFRLLRGDVPSDDDFLSHRALNHSALYNACECTTRAVSLFSDFEGAKNLQALPLHKGKKIAKVTLTEAAGVVRRQGAKRGHHSWWRASAFDVMSCCSVV